jgi:hypothetical protein
LIRDFAHPGRNPLRELRVWSEGTYVTAGNQLMALVDTNSFWVAGLPSISQTVDWLACPALCRPHTGSRTPAGPVANRSDRLCGDDAHG